MTIAPASPDDTDDPLPSETGEGDGVDRVSITGVHGTVAHFEMSYSPPTGAKTKFGPPLRETVPSILYLVGAVLLGSVVLYAYDFAPSSSRLFSWIVEGDRGRPISASVLAGVVLVSALGTATRAHMLGVLVSDDWIEARYLLPFGIPRARRWAWPQVLRLIVDGGHVALEFWDGSYERLPSVARSADLVTTLQHLAERHRVDVTVLPSLKGSGRR